MGGDVVGMETWPIQRDVTENEADLHAAFRNFILCMAHLYCHVAIPLGPFYYVFFLPVRLRWSNG